MKVLAYLMYGSFKKACSMEAGGVMRTAAEERATKSVVAIRIRIIDLNDYIRIIGESI